MPLPEAFAYFRRAMNMGAWRMAYGAIRQGVPREAFGMLRLWARGGTIALTGVGGTNYALGAMRIGALGAGLYGGYRGLGYARRHPGTTALGIGAGAAYVYRPWALARMAGARTPLWAARAIRRLVV